MIYLLTIHWNLNDFVGHSTISQISKVPCLGKNKQTKINKKRKIQMLFKYWLEVIFTFLFISEFSQLTCCFVEIVRKSWLKLAVLTQVPSDGFYGSNESKSGIVPHTSSCPPHATPLIPLTRTWYQLGQEMYWNTGRVKDKRISQDSCLDWRSHWTSHWRIQDYNNLIDQIFYLILWIPWESASLEPEVMTAEEVNRVQRPPAGGHCLS